MKPCINGCRISWKIFFRSCTLKRWAIIPLFGELSWTYFLKSERATSVKNFNLLETRTSVAFIKVNLEDPTYYCTMKFTSWLKFTYHSKVLSGLPSLYCMKFIEMSILIIDFQVFAVSWHQPKGMLRVFVKKKGAVGHSLLLELSWNILRITSLNTIKPWITFKLNSNPRLFVIPTTRNPFSRLKLSTWLFGISWQWAGWFLSIGSYYKLVHHSLYPILHHYLYLLFPPL